MSNEMWKSIPYCYSGYQDKNVITAKSLVRLT